MSGSNCVTSLLDPSFFSQLACFRYFEDKISLSKSHVLSVCPKKYLVSNYMAGQTVPDILIFSELKGIRYLNLRNRSLQSIDHDDRTLRYSSLVTLSHAYALTVRSELTKCIEKTGKVVKDSKDEAAYCYLVDFFPFS